MIEYLLTYGIPGIFIFIFVYMIINPGKVEIWHGMIARLFAGISERAEKSSVSKEIQGRINTVSKKINKESDGTIPYGMQIEWIKEKTKDTFIRDGNIVVRMQNHKNQAQNLAYATLTFLSEGCIPTARPYVNEDVLESIDLTLAKRILISEHQEKALRYLNDEIFNKIVEKKPEIQNHTNTMESLSNSGLFTRIFLREFLMMGDRQAHQIPTNDMKNETKEFLELMDNLVKKEKDEDINPTYNGNFIKSDIVLIARYETFLRQGVVPYINFIINSLGRGIETFYLLGSGKNVLATKSVSHNLEKDGRFTKIYEDNYYLPYRKGRRTEAIIIIFVKKNT